MLDILSEVMKQYQQMILDDLSKSYGLDRETLFRRYHTPSFYQPYVVPREKNIYYVEKGHKEKAETMEKK